MKKQLLLVSASLFALAGPLLRANAIAFSDDFPFTFNLEQPSLKIVQFTDLHLTYGFDYNDQRTFKLIRDITLAVEPDLIVFTGDQTLSIYGDLLYGELSRQVDGLNTPWTFVFGNHDDDFQSYEQVLRALYRTNPENLYFKVGPSLSSEGFRADGYGNFYFNYYYNDLPFYNLYFLDSHDELDRRESDSLSRYKYLTPAQVSWFETKVSADALDNIKSSVFMHIPLVEYAEAPNSATYLLSGLIGESIYTQSKNTGFFTVMQNSGVSEAVFVGHDHRNNFVFEKEGIKLVYGQNSGFNGYGNMRRGARVIEINEGEPLNTYVIYGDLEYEI